MKSLDALSLLFRKLYFLNFCLAISTSLLTILLLSTSFKVNAQTLNNFNQFNNSYSNYRNVFNATDTTGILTQVGRWAWGQMGNTAVVGNYAYIGNGAMFQVLDISQPSSPKLVSEILTNGLVGSIKIHGSYAYITGPFQIIDISDPLHPKIAAAPLMSDIILGLTIYGNYLYAGSFSGTVYIFDITDPVNPKQLSTLNSGGENTLSSVVVGNFMYTTAIGSFGILEYDISDKSNPKYITTYPISDAFGRVIGYGNYLYLIGNGNYMYVYDVSVANEPAQVGSVYLPSGEKTLFVQDTLAYLGIYQDSTRFKVIDVADEHHPKIISSIYWTDPILDVSNLGLPSMMSMIGNTGYISTNDGLWIIDKSNIYNVKTLSFFITSGDPESLAIDSYKHVYVATQFTGLKIIDYSDLTTPHLIGQYIPHDRVDYVCVSGSYAYVLADTDLRVVNISNPTEPIEEDVIPLVYSNGNSTIILEGRMLISGTKLFVVGSAGKLFTIDVSNPTSAVVKSEIQTNTTPIYLSLSGRYLYVTDLDSAIEIFDVSDIDNIHEVAIFDVSGPLRAAQVQGKNLYAIAGCGFTVYDVSDSLKPVKLSCISNLPWGIAYAFIVPLDSLVYLGYPGYVILINVSDRMNPIIVDTLKITPFGVWDMSVSNDILIIAGGISGIGFYKNNLITNIQTQKNNIIKDYYLYQNYPNPFNPTTFIQYQIQKPGKVVLKIYDVLGREIETLINHYQAAGMHSVEFNAQNLPSGVYLYRLTSHGRSTTRKLVLLK